MTETTLDQLQTLSDDGRLALLREARDPDALLLQFSDEAERLAFAEPGRATIAATLVVELADVAGGPRARARARRAHAQALAYTGRFDDALASCDAAVRIGLAGDEPVEAARARLASLHSLAHLGRFDDALAAGDAARLAFLEADEPALAARADLNLGAVHAMRDNPRQALTHLDRARQALSADPLLLAQIEANRGNALTSLDDYAAAEDAYRRAAAGFEQGGHASAAMLAEGNLAHLATRQGSLHLALHHFERARRLLEGEEAAAGHARLLAEQADALLALGLPRDAADAYRQILPELQQLGLVAETAQAQFGLGRALLRDGRLDEAGGALQEAAAAFETLGQTTHRARVELALAELNIAQGDEQQAAEHATHALADLWDRPADVAAARTLIAALAVAAGDLDGAAREVSAALMTASRLGLSPLVSTLHLIRARLHRARHLPDRARADYRAAIAEIERVRGTLQAERFRLAFLGTRLVPYEELVTLALDEAMGLDLAEAFATVERSKSRTLLDLVGQDNESPAPPRGPDEADLHAQIARLRTELNWHYSRQAEASPGDAQASESTLADVADREEELTRLEDRLAATRGPGNLLLPASLAETQAALPPGTALLEYFIASGNVLAFLVQRSSVQVYRDLVTSADLDQQLRRLRFQIGRGLAMPDAGEPRAERMLADARRELRALDALLLAPIRPAISLLDHLIVVPHGPLHAVPFHALWDGERYLNDALAVTYAPSASIATHLATRPLTAPANPPLLVGVADELAPGIAEEVERVASALPGARLLEGTAATAERVSTAAAAVPILHLACHGRFAPEHPATSGLKLHDRWLTPREIAALRLPGAHITLSACDSGRAHVTTGDELLGLARAFLTAGASSILMSLWPVHDATARDAMVDFYTRLGDGETKGDALRAAQIACRDRRPHPAYWAPFILGGQS